MNILSNALAVFGFLLLVDWTIIPMWWFRMFIQYKHGDYYTRLDNLIYGLAYKRGRYDPEKDAHIKLVAFLSLLLSGIISLIISILPYV